MPGTFFDAFWLYDGLTPASIQPVSARSPAFDLRVSCSAHQWGADWSPGYSFDCFDVQEGDLAPDHHQLLYHLDRLLDHLLSVVSDGTTCGCGTTHRQDSLYTGAGKDNPICMVQASMIHGAAPMYVASL